MKQDKTLQRYKKVLGELRKYQGTDGSFLIDSGTPFHSSLILHSLHALRDAVQNEKGGMQGIIRSLEKMSREYCSFLLKERSDGWSWNYWKRNSVQAKSKPYPDDMDDTACALAALSHFNKEPVEEKGLAAFAHLLIAQESAVGGPYQTWIVPTALKQKWSDIDPAVNANIAYALGLHGVELPALNEMFERCMAESAYASKYYHSPLAILYFISRAYRGSQTDNAISYLIKHAENNCVRGNVLHAALAASALARFCKLHHAADKDKKGRDAEHSSLIKSAETFMRKAMLLLEKSIDGNSWKSYPFYIEEDKEETVHSGSVPLTIAFAIEAHAVCERYFSDEAMRESLRKKKAQETEMLEEIIDNAKLRFAGIPYFGKRASAMIDTMTNKDPGNQIALLSYHFQKSMKQSKRAASSMRNIRTIGTANVHGWLAYKIYDDILDNEGEPADIPIANIALRESCSLFASSMPQKGEGTMTHILDQIDAANAWERVNCFKRQEDGTLSTEPLPDYGKLDVLAQKSMGHALGPLALIFAAGHGPESTEARAAFSFFKNYIIARQLNDDAHDWLEDLERGFVNPVSTMLLNAWKKAYPSCGPNISIQDSKKELQKLFWHQTIDLACDAINKHLKLARKALASMKSLSDTTYLESLLAPIQSSTEKALGGRDAALKFLKSY